MSVSELAGSERVRVVVRCRPLSQSEIRNGHKSIVEVDSQRGVVSLSNPKSADETAREFTFDAAYGCDCSQAGLYLETFATLVDSVLDGFNGTIFAYGQTGTGKTFTMEGVADDVELCGVIPRSFDQIFQHIAGSCTGQYLVRASYMEIYQEEIRDLLATEQGGRLELRERPDSGVYVRHLSSMVCATVGEMRDVMRRGNANRSVGATNMNERSSRSHALYVVTVEYAETVSADAAYGTVASSTDTGADDATVRFRVGKLNLVDLAGSERQTKTGATGERLKEATKINMSLSALGNVISALVDGKWSHVPYRDSKLTRLLQDSLGGNARTVMVSNIGPASYNYEETLTTLRYASRAKNVKNRPKVNEDAKDAMLRQFQAEIERLKLQLQARAGDALLGGAVDGSSLHQHHHNRRRRRKTGGDGLDSGREDSSDSSGEQLLQQQRHQLEQQRAEIINNKTLIDEDRDRLLLQLQHREQLLDEQLQQQQQLVARIQAIQSKLLHGRGLPRDGGDGGGIDENGAVDSIRATASRQEQQLQQHRHQLAEQKMRERQVLQQLEHAELGRLDVQHTYSSLQHELLVKSKQLKKLFRRLAAARCELAEVEDELSGERRDLQALQHQLHKEIKLKTALLDHLVSDAWRRRVVARAVYDDDADEWRLRPGAPRHQPPQPPTPPDSVLHSSPPAAASGEEVQQDEEEEPPVGSLPQLLQQLMRDQYVGDCRGELYTGVLINPVDRLRRCDAVSLRLDAAECSTRVYQRPPLPAHLQRALSAALTPATTELSVDAAASLHVTSFLQRAARKPRSTPSPQPPPPPPPPSAAAAADPVNAASFGALDSAHVRGYSSDRLFGNPSAAAAAAAAAGGGGGGGGGGLCRLSMSSAQRRQSPRPSAHYPESRGLVPK